jgi:hypothetical protein
VKLVDGNGDLPGRRRRHRAVGELGRSAGEEGVVQVPRIVRRDEEGGVVVEVAEGVDGVGQGLGEGAVDAVAE